MSSPKKIDWEKMEEKPASTGLKLAGVINWLIAWPVLMLIFAVILYNIGYWLIGGLYSRNPPEGSILRLYFFLFIIMMVGLCIIFSKLQKRSEHAFVKIGSPVLTVYMWLGILFGGLAMAYIPDPAPAGVNAGINTQTAPGFTAPELQHEPTIVAVLREIGATDINMIDTRYVDGYKSKIDDQWGEYVAYDNQATGQFVYGTLTVRRGLDQNQLRVAVAHEYLHHVWFAVLDAQTKEDLTSHLITMYGNDSGMRERVKGYADEGFLQPTELFSYYCTESSDGYLTSYVRKQCNKYIRRGALILNR